MIVFCLEDMFITSLHSSLSSKSLPEVPASYKLIGIFNGKSCITPHSMFAQPQTGTTGHLFKIMVTLANTDIRQHFSQRLPTTFFPVKPL